MNEIAIRAFDIFFSNLARKPKLDAGLIEAAASDSNLNQTHEKKMLKAAIKVTESYRSRLQFGRLRAAVLAGATLFGETFVLKAERAGVLLADKVPLKKFGWFLTNLQSEATVDSHPMWQLLGNRLATYRTYHEFVCAISADEQGFRGMLRDRPRHIIRLALILTHLCFLRHYFDFPVSREIGEWLDTFRTPEDMANIASILVASANQQRPLDSLDFGFPIGGMPLNRQVEKLMEYGRALYLKGEVGEYISIFGYTLYRSSSHDRTVFHLQAPFPSFEYSLRLGFIRTEMGKAKTPLELNKAASIPQLSLRSVAATLAAKWQNKLHEIKAEIPEARRVRLTLPAAPKLYKWVTETVFYEDLSYTEQLGQDFMIPTHGDDNHVIRLSENLDLITFHRIWRHVQFACLLDISVLKSYATQDRTILYNSLFRVMSERDFIDFVTLLGVSVSQAHDFLQLVAADANHLGYYHIQYRPFLRIATTTLPKEGIITKPEIVHFPGFVGLSNSLRNVQVANQIRLESSAGVFVDTVAEAFKHRFPRVTSNRRVQADQANTDVDVVVFENNTLYLFECKYSIPATDPHELRDIWEDVEGGIRQLEQAVHILSNANRLQSYLAGWFPGTKAWEAQMVKIKTCVLSSHRLFAGMHFRGIPVRDFASLNMLLGEAVVGFGSMEADGESVMYRYRIVGEKGATAADLDDYLAEDSKYFTMFAPFTRQFCEVHNLGNLILSRDTYVYEAESDDWDTHLRTLGFTRLEEKREKVRFPLSVEEILTNLQRENLGG